MASELVLLVVGGLLTFLSAIGGFALNHWLDMRKAVMQSKQYPARVVYDKQIEFFDLVGPILLRLNDYITTIDAWLGETSEDAKLELQKAQHNSMCLTRLMGLLDRYYVYLPKGLVEEAKELHTECFVLSSSAKMERTQDCITRLVRFQNRIREYVGIDALSDELLRAFGTRGAKHEKSKEGE